MKKIICLLLASLYGLSIYTQTFNAEGGEYIYAPNKAECLTKEDRVAIITMLQENQQLLSIDNKRSFSEKSKSGGVLFSWPVAKSSSSNYESIWAISNYVDHNAAYPSQLSDFDCGTRTYDTSGGYNHRGIDVYTWPFTWKLMDNDEAEVLAGAAGQIIAKSDGNFDRSCSLSGGSWNAIYVEHSDGTVAWYGHMKNGSLTTKGVGDTVSEGEFLGVIGSSGNSTGPHLHFEVWEDSTYTNLLDPYAGPCNNLNANTMWQSQKPYLNSNINSVLTHTAPPVFPACPTTETTNESTEFDTTDTIYFALYMRDQMDLTSINLKIIRPDNSVLYNWDHNFTADFYSSYWYWNYTGVFNQEGEWKWEASYLGQTVTHSFNVSFPLNADEAFKKPTIVHPNPFNDDVNIISNTQIKKATIVDILGKTIKILEEKNIQKIELSTISKGIYFITLEGGNNQTKTVKLIKK